MEQLRALGRVDHEVLCHEFRRCLNCLHVWLLSIVGALTAPTFMALTCRWRSRPQHQKRTSDTAAKCSHLVTPQRPKKFADLMCQSIRLLHGGEVSSGLHDGPAVNVGIDSLSHRTRWPDDLFGELAIAHRNVDCARPRPVHSRVIRVK